MRMGLFRLPSIVSTRKRKIINYRTVNKWPVIKIIPSTRIDWFPVFKTWRFIIKSIEL